MNNLKVIGLTLLAIIAAMLGVYGVGRKAGKKAVELKQVNHTLKAIREAKHVKQEIDNSDIGTIRDGLRDWTRD